MQFSPIWEIATGKSEQNMKNCEKSELRTISGNAKLWEHVRTIGEIYVIMAFAGTT